MKSLLFAATALVLLGGSAYAQTTNSGSNATATNSSQSGSLSVSNPHVNVIGNPIGNGASSSNSSATANTRSTARSNAVGNVTSVTVNTSSGVSGSGNSRSNSRAGVNGSGNSRVGGAGTGGASGGGAAGDPAGTTGAAGANGAGTNGAGTIGSGQGGGYVEYGGGYTVHNTPEVIPPSVVGGNACAVGASAGMSVAGFGIAGGATWADKACERRQQSALLYNMGEAKVAYELMCQDENVRAAMRVSGKPCIGDAAVAAVSAPIVAATVATPVAAPAAMPAKPKPDWCARAKPSTEASKVYFEQQCS